MVTSSKPRKLQMEGVEHVNYLNNESIFHIKQIPKRLLVVCGRPIGMEMAQAMQRLGNEVTVIEKGNGILNHDDKIL